MIIINCNKQQILNPLESGYSHIFEELKNDMLNEIHNGNQLRIITQTEGCPIENVELLTTEKDLDNWFQPYGF